MYGSFTAHSAYAETVFEAVEGGGLLVFVRQHLGSEDGEARINLSPEQSARLRDWLATDRDTDTCLDSELHPGMTHAEWAKELAASEPGDIPLHLETRSEYDARMQHPVLRPSMDYVAWRDRIRHAHGS